MARPALRIEVPAKDRKELRELLSGGVQQVRVVLRALALSQLAKGVSAPRISAVVPLTPQAIRNVAHRYQKGGLERALYESARPGAAEVLDDGISLLQASLRRRDNFFSCNVAVGEPYFSNTSSLQSPRK